MLHSIADKKKKKTLKVVEAAVSSMTPGFKRLPNLWEGRLGGLKQRKSRISFFHFNHRNVSNNYTISFNHKYILLIFD